MIAFIVRRTFLAAFTVFSISVFSFVIIQLPAGDFADNYVNKLVDIASGGASSFHGEGVRELKQAIRKRMGLDRPMYYQYYRWARRIVTGDLGISLEYGRPVWEIIRARLLMTVVLTVATVLFTWLLAIPIGIYTAVRQRSAADYTMDLRRLHWPGDARLPAGPGPPIRGLRPLRHESCGPLLP